MSDDTGSTTTFLYDGSNLAAEYSGSTVLRRYVPSGLGVDMPLVWYEGAAEAAPRWLHADNQGSIVAWSDAGGNNDDIMGYDPWGLPDAANGWSGSRFRYTGQITIPQADLYYYKARVYDPGLGRFLQTDPVGYASDVNAYAYVHNSPVNGADPSGLSCDMAPQDEGSPNACEYDGGPSYSLGGGNIGVDASGMTQTFGGQCTPSGCTDSVGSTLTQGPGDLVVTALGYGPIVPGGLMGFVFIPYGNGFQSTAGSGGGKGAQSPQNIQKGCQGSGSLASQIAKIAGNVSNVSSGVALVSGGAALVTSETVVGGIGFATVAAGAEALSLGASGVEAVAQYYDKNYGGMSATIAGGALSLAFGPLGNRFAAASQVAADAPAMKFLFNVHATPIALGVSNSCFASSR